VKDHQATAPARLSRDQENMEEFIESRLQRAVEGKGHWENATPEVRQRASH